MSDQKTPSTGQQSFEVHRVMGLALDPIHVGTGGARLGRVDNSIVRDPVTGVPKIPGSSLAGVLRSYVAMHEQASNGGRKVNGKKKPYFPDCAGQGQPGTDGSGGHCGQPDCKVCTVFGFARGERGGFAGLASFSDAHVLLFPVATRSGPLWITAPVALRQLSSLRDSGAVVDHARSDDTGDDGAGADVGNLSAITDNVLYRAESSSAPLNLGWLLLEVRRYEDAKKVTKTLNRLGVPDYIRDRVGIVSDKLFSHVVNSNLEVRTSVAIDPATGAAEAGALFTYEALPRGTVLIWDITCRNPKHFRIGSGEVEAVKSMQQIHEVVATGFPYLQALGIGGMGTRGMGRLRVLNDPDGQQKEQGNSGENHQNSPEGS